MDPLSFPYQNIRHSRALSQINSNLGLLIDIHFSEDNIAVGGVDRGLLEFGRYGSARTTPSGPEVDHDNLIAFDLRGMSGIASARVRWGIGRGTHELLEFGQGLDRFDHRELT